MHSSKLHLLQVPKLNTGCPTTLQQQANLATHYCAGTDTPLNTRGMQHLHNTRPQALEGAGRQRHPSKHLKTTDLTMTEAPEDHRREN